MTIKFTVKKRKMNFYINAKSPDPYAEMVFVCPHVTLCSYVKI